MQPHGTCLTLTARRHSAPAPIRPELRPIDHHLDDPGRDCTDLRVLPDPTRRGHLTVPRVWNLVPRRLLDRIRRLHGVRLHGVDATADGRIPRGWLTVDAGATSCTPAILTAGVAASGRLVVAASSSSSANRPSHRSRSRFTRTCNCRLAPGSDATPPAPLLERDIMDRDRGRWRGAKHRRIRHRGDAPAGAGRPHTSARRLVSRSDATPRASVLGRTSMDKTRCRRRNRIGRPCNNGRNVTTHYDLRTNRPPPRELPATRTASHLGRRRRK